MNLHPVFNILFGHSPWKTPPSITVLVTLNSLVIKNLRWCSLTVTFHVIKDFIILIFFTIYLQGKILISYKICGEEKLKDIPLLTLKKVRLPSLQHYKAISNTLLFWPASLILFLQSLMVIKIFRWETFFNKFVIWLLFCLSFLQSSLWMERHLAKKLSFSNIR